MQDRRYQRPWWGSGNEEERGEDQDAKATIEKDLGKITRARSAPGAKGRETLVHAHKVLGDALGPLVDELDVLATAVRWRDMEAVELLLGWGADPNASPTQPSRSPRALGVPFDGLDWKDEDRVRFVRRLLEAGASRDALHSHSTGTDWGAHRTALDWALEKRSDALADLLAALADGAERRPGVPVVRLRTFSISLDEIHRPARSRLR